MSSQVLALILSSAALHAVWNYYMKRDGGGKTLLWLFNLLGIFLYLPVLVIFWKFDIIGSYQWRWYIPLVALVSGGLNALFFITLVKAYRLAEFSFVYATCRGVGPLTVFLLAGMFLGERLGWLAIAGIFFIIFGVALMAVNPRRLRQLPSTKAIVFAALSGVCLGLFSLWDKYSVGVLQIPPLLSYMGTMVVTLLFFSPLTTQARSEVTRCWRKSRGAAIMIAVFCPLAYILILWTLTFTPVSYVAPLREVSIIFSVLIGAGSFNEKDTTRKIIATLIIILGVNGIAFGS
ncbi:MAG: DMT family transporter [Bacillota bacterium]